MQDTFKSRYTSVHIILFIHVIMEVTTTTRGKPKLLWAGYAYTKHTEKNGMIRWRCTCRASKHCPASVYTNLLPANAVLKTDHNHCPEPVKFEVARCRTEMRVCAAACNDPPSRIYADNITALTDAAKAILPSVDTCKRTIARNRTQEYPAEPASLVNLHIVPPWTHTLGQQEEEFLFFDNGPQATHRIVAYATEDNLRRLAAADKWFMDGNFAMAPPKFLQLYVIHVSLGEVTIPLVYAFLENKTEATYHELFTAILNRCATYGVQPDPDVVMVDFELAVPRAVAGVFGQNVQVQFCFYHLTQSTWRKIQEMGLVVSYRTDNNFRHFCGMLDGLAFLPPTDVSAGMAHLRTIAPALAAPLVDYFDKTYVHGHYRQGRLQVGGIRMVRIAPLYPVQTWNVHNATVNDNPRTNNVSEAWNNKYRHLIGHQHPSIWKSIKCLQREQECVSAIIIQDATGQPPRKRVRHEYVRLQTRLRNLCRDYVNGVMQVPQFLTAIGHLVRL